jgi:hypothetical protein
LTAGPQIKVGKFSNPTALSRSRHQNRPSSRSWSRVLGLVGTLSLHGIAIQTIIANSDFHKPRPPDVQGAEVGRVDPGAATAEELVLVAIADVQKNDLGIKEPIISLEPQLKKLPIPIISPDPLPLFSFETADDAPGITTPAVPDAGDPAIRALMFGRYTGQISARIERAWVRPRSAVTSDAVAAPHRDVTDDSTADGNTFRCRVQIRQDAHGNVQEVLLVDCNGTEAWRHSLVIAINQSSPLPAPPIPSVFRRLLNMTFEAQAYQQGDAPDEYERESQSAQTLELSPAVRAISEPAIAANPSGTPER